MNSFSPIGAGFRLVVRRRPAIALAEIAWRWTFAATAWFLGGGLIFGYLDSLPVGRVETFLLRTGQPYLVWRALRNIFAGTLLRFTEAAILTALAIALIWILLASVGRLLVVRAIVSEFGLPSTVPHRGRFGKLLFLNFLRVALLLATKLSAVGALLIASSVWSSTHMRAGDALRIFALASFLITVIWLALDWLLATSAVVAIVEPGSQSGLLGAVGLLRHATGATLITAISFGILQMFGIAALCGAALSLLTTAGHPAVLLFLEFTLVLVYSIVSNFLHAASVAAYVRILKGEEPAITPQSAPEPDSPEHGQAMDHSELILSDVPVTG